MTSLPTTAEDALFHRDGDRFIPTVATQGPWDPGAQHGGPVASLLTHGVEQLPTLVPMAIARLTFDLLRPAPIAPLTIHGRIVREGKRIQIVETVLAHDGTEVALCRALRIREGDTSHPEVVEHPRRPPVTPPRPPDGSGRPLHPGMDRSKVGFIRAIEVERVVGDVLLGAPAVMWVRVKVPLVAGEETTPYERMALAGDFTSAVAAYLDGRRYSFINPDVNLHVLRPPTSDWIGVDGTSWVGASGIGHSRAGLYDLEGLIGSGTAAQVVEERHQPDWGGR